MTIQWMSAAMVCVARVVAHTRARATIGADRQVDAAAADDEGHADADDADDRGEAQDRQRVVDAGEAVAGRDHADDDEQQRGR